MHKDLIKIQEILTSHKRKILKPNGLKSAAVLFPFVCAKADKKNAVKSEKNKLYLLFTKRTDKVRDHKSQISFPGGMIEDIDNGDLYKTALRESNEEIGLPYSKVDLLGVLDDYITITKYLVTPYAAYINNDFEIIINPDEIARIIWVPWEYFLDVKEIDTLNYEYKERKGMSYIFEYNNHVIWGATAAMLFSLLEIIRPGLGLNRLKLK